MTHLELAEEILLLGLLAAFGLLYVVQRFSLHRYRKHAKAVLHDLCALEVQIRDPLFLQSPDQAVAIAERLERLESRLTSASKRLMKWRSNETERWIIGKHIEPLIVDYERAGAMTTRLLAILARNPAPRQPVRLTSTAAASAAS